ncbi:TIGR02221 family CRISPR-associated protein [Halosquirtibacter laminarini]|uniref:TIGR02221 family CRISPR-associated protein n=1 Tax=Halosquirtibacter laminarini TaxID=3374600 RepID=A0AC61NIF2_9BACT|nr:TIGR02221 family CRISPR-associated protein [Prolixibacteraceae bacterium]
MGRNILISFLGKTNYSKTIYQLEGKECSTPTFTPMDALREYYPFEFCYVFGTADSSWDYLLKEEFKNIDLSKEDFIRQKSSLAIRMRDHKIKPEIIHYGKNKHELEENLKIIINALIDLRDGDKIFIDITYSFRSIPLFAMNVIQYLKEVSPLNIEIGGVFYGMFLAKDPSTGIVPLVDMGPTIELMDWIKAASEFKDHQTADKFASLLGRNDLKQEAERMQSYIAINSVTHLRKSVTEFKNLWLNVSDSIHKRLVSPAVLDFPDNISKRGEGKEYLILAKLSDLQWKQGQYLASITSCWEALISYVWSIYKSHNNKGYPKSFCFNIISKHLCGKEYFYYDSLPSIDNEFREKIDDFRGYRNMMVHADEKKGYELDADMIDKELKETRRQIIESIRTNIIGPVAYRIVSSENFGNDLKDKKSK